MEKSKKEILEELLELRNMLKGDNLNYLLELKDFLMQEDSLKELIGEKVMITPKDPKAHSYFAVIRSIGLFALELYPWDDPLLPVLPYKGTPRYLNELENAVKKLDRSDNIKPKWISKWSYSEINPIENLINKALLL